MAGESQTVLSRRACLWVPPCPRASSGGVPGRNLEPAALGAHLSATLCPEVFICSDSRGAASTGEAEAQLEGITVWGPAARTTGDPRCCL